MRHARLERIALHPPAFSYLKHLPTIHPSFVTITKPLSNEWGQTFCEGLKWMCQPFEINGPKDS